MANANEYTADRAPSQEVIEAIDQLVINERLLKGEGVEDLLLILYFVFQLIYIQLGSRSWWKQ